ncbi:772_t:CDS:2, partial [Racocetra persica]
MPSGHNNIGLPQYSGNRIMGCQNSVFYLDLSVSFDTQGNIPWTDLTTIAGSPVNTCWQVSALAGPNNTSIYAFGGVMVDKSTTFSVDTVIYEFDTKTQQWSTPEISGTLPKRRKEFQIVQDNSGKAYMFGGLSDNSTGSTKVKWFNDMDISDIISMSWSKVSTSKNKAPPLRADFTATMLNNSIIVYIGGRQANPASAKTKSYSNMDQIWTYDTKNASWMLVTAAGTVPGVRIGHSAVLALDGRIIVFGGYDQNLSPASPALAVLDTSTSPFRNYTWVTSTDTEIPLSSPTNSSITNPTLSTSPTSTTTPDYTTKTPSYSITPQKNGVISSRTGIILGTTIGAL